MFELKNQKTEDLFQEHFSAMAMVRKQTFRGCFKSVAIKNHALRRLEKSISSLHEHIFNSDKYDSKSIVKFHF